MGSLPTWEKATLGSEAAAAFADKIHDKTVLITGLSPKGLGATAARIVATHRPAILLVTYRSEEKANPVLLELRVISPNTKVIAVFLDLSDLESCRQAADQVNKSIDHLDILINNAGVMSIQERTLTSHGIEMTFGTNHIGHFLFTNLIMDKILAAAAKNPSGATRIVNVTGGWHHFSPFRFDDFNFDGKPMPPEQEPNRVSLAKFGCKSGGVYLPEAAYGQSKTANILFSVYLMQHLSKKGILSFAPNPGGILTEIGRHIPQARADEIIKSGLLDKTPDQGVSGILVAAFDPRLTVESPLYIDNGQAKSPSTYASDPALAEKLWKLSEEVVGQQFNI